MRNATVAPETVAADAAVPPGARGAGPAVGAAAATWTCDLVDALLVSRIIDLASPRPKPPRSLSSCADPPPLPSSLRRRTFRARPSGEGAAPAMRVVRQPD